MEKKTKQKQKQNQTKKKKQISLSDETIITYQLPFQYRYYLFVCR